MLGLVAFMACSGAVGMTLLAWLGIGGAGSKASFCRSGTLLAWLGIGGADSKASFCGSGTLFACAEAVIDSSRPKASFFPPKLAAIALFRASGSARFRPSADRARSCRGRSFATVASLGLSALSWQTPFATAISGMRPAMKVWGFSGFDWITSRIASARTSSTRWSKRYFCAASTRSLARPFLSGGGTFFAAPCTASFMRMLLKSGKSQGTSTSWNTPFGESMAMLT
mmetsp:Transcript_112967/g.360840  ORF Transcript_112967/g.360840 Transcript_112967/m.360840 type:complete len:227 (+) Transcript_112967:732-1412(+)